MTTKPNFCSACPLNNFTDGYVPLKRGSSSELWVGEAAGETEAAIGLPFIGGAGSVLENLCRGARIEKKDLNIINTIGCRPRDNVYPLDDAWRWTSREVAREGVAYCARCHLWPAINSRRWSRIVAIGEQALAALTPRHGISIWRGSALPLKGSLQELPIVMPTYHPSYIMRNAHLSSVVVGDLKRRINIPREEYNLYATYEDVDRWKSRCFAFDFEWDYKGDITICGLSDRYFRADVVTWDVPYIGGLKRIFESAEELIGHNIIGADTLQFEKLGWDISKAKLWDTMLMQHLVQPDYRHGLGFVASVFTNKVFWKSAAEEESEEEGYTGGGAQWKTWDQESAIPRQFGGYGGCKSGEEAYRLYNARDTDGSYQCWVPLKTMLEKYEMDWVYWNVSVPAAFICRDVVAKGLKVDGERVGIIREVLNEEIERTEKLLPEGLKPYEMEVVKQVKAPPGTWREKVKICTGTKKNVHGEIRVVFKEPGGSWECPGCGKILSAGKMVEAKTIKVPGVERVVPWNSTAQVMEYATKSGCREVIHKKTKKATGDKNARKIWGKGHNEFILVDVLKRAATRRNSFAKPGLVGVDRMFFNLLVHGTSEGRLSSSGKRKGIDANIQNQPKDIRKIFVPDYPDWGYVAGDLVQAENMITAWLAKDYPRLERLNTPGFDEHSHMASLFFGEPIEKVSKGGELAGLRKPGKVINHGKNYLLGPVKAQEYLLAEGYQFSQAEVKEFFNIWERENARTAEWQKEVIEEGTRKGVLTNPFGRKRWFQSRASATKMAAFLPASTVADAVIRMMIGLHAHQERLKEAVYNLGLAVTGRLPEGWELRIQVHDELTTQGPWETRHEAADVLRLIMTQPWKELGGFAFRVDLAESQISWGDMKEIKEK